MHPAIDRLLVRASREVQLLAALSPVDAAEERARLNLALRAGSAACPRWSYPRASQDELRRALDEAERELAAEAATPLGAAYLARTRELALEAALCAAAGTDRLAALARERFAAASADVAREASGLCAAWLEAGSAPDGASPALLASDSADAASLLSRMRAEIGRRRLPFSVVVHAPLAPLAATGDGVILVAPGRMLAQEDVTRTVLHEIEGHAAPRASAAASPLLLLRVGTARGVDEQEGRALVLEDRAGMLGPRRRRQLAARHRAVEAMLGGGSFADVASLLVREHGLDASDAVVVAERAFRGGDGVRPGLGRERVYLESFVRVRAHLARHPADESVLAAGQVAIEAIEAVRGAS